jgi:hypothetical protein
LNGDADFMPIDEVVELLAQKDLEAADLVKMYDAQFGERETKFAREIADLKALNGELISALKDAGRQPIHVHMAEGMVTNTTNVAPPNVNVEVSPPNLLISEGAIKAQITNQSPSADLEIVHPGGQKTTLRRR